MTNCISILFSHEGCGKEREPWLFQMKGRKSIIWLQGIPQRREVAKPHEACDAEQREADSKKKIPLVIESV